LDDVSPPADGDNPDRTRSVEQVASAGMQQKGMPCGLIREDLKNIKKTIRSEGFSGYPKLKKFF
jgi:hypothetical protein